MTGRSDGRPLNGSDAQKILRLAFAWIEQAPESADRRELDGMLREAGYELPPPPVPRTPRQGRVGDPEVAPLTFPMVRALILYAEGKSQREIAAFFRRKEATVAGRLREARRRLGVATLDEAVVEARRRGLI